MKMRRALDGSRGGARRCLLVTDACRAECAAVAADFASPADEQTYASRRFRVCCVVVEQHDCLQMQEKLDMEMKMETMHTLTV